MLNCGATVDLKQNLSLQSKTCLVIDSHRPIHLGNIKESENVIVVDLVEYRYLL